MADGYEPLNDRQKEIVETVEQTGFATVAELAERFDVTTQTIRRDVNALCVSQRLARFHGGVGLPNSIHNEDYTDRRTSLTAGKDQIGKLVAGLVPHRASVFMNIGTTTETVATHLLNHQSLRVVTNNLHIADMFSRKTDFETMVAGGVVRGSDGGIVGEAAIEFLSGFRLDIGIIGISGIDVDGALLDFDFREVRAAQAIIANARKTILVADHTKFGRAAMAKVAHLDDIDVLVTDQPVAPAYAEAIARAGVEVHTPPLMAEGAA